MKEIDNLPHGIEIYSGIISADEAEYFIDTIEAATYSSGKCDAKWGTPQLHSPDISCLRRNLAINLSQHSFQNTECDCGIRQVESALGKIMLKCLEKYTNKYSVSFTQDEGFLIVKRGEKHVDKVGVDDNPFVNRVLSMHMPLNVEKGREYIKFPNIDYSISLSYPSLIFFPSNFLFSYSKNNYDDLYEVQNFFNDNPSQEYFEQAFNQRPDQA